VWRRTAFGTVSLPERIPLRTDRRRFARPKLAALRQQNRDQRKPRRAGCADWPLHTAATSQTHQHLSRATHNHTHSVPEFFARQGKKIDFDSSESRPGTSASRSESRADSSGSSANSGSSKSSGGLKVGTRVKHAKYGVGLIVKREGEGGDAKLTINFP